MSDSAPSVPAPLDTRAIRQLVSRVYVTPDDTVVALCDEVDRRVAENEKLRAVVRWLATELAAQFSASTADDMIAKANAALGVACTPEEVSRAPRSSSPGSETTP